MRYNVKLYQNLMQHLLILVTGRILIIIFLFIVVSVLII
jgi:hypothetical protein